MEPEQKAVSVVTSADESSLADASLPQSEASDERGEEATTNVNKEIDDKKEEKASNSSPLGEAATAAVETSASSASPASSSSSTTTTSLQSDGRPPPSVPLSATELSTQQMEAHHASQAAQVQAATSADLFKIFQEACQQFKITPWHKVVSQVRASSSLIDHISTHTVQWIMAKKVANW